MQPKKRKGVRAYDSVQGNPAVKDQPMGMFEHGTITANTNFDEIYDEQPAFQVVQRKKFCSIC